jgi:energy-coupling factor transporter ATP-binding protein EcfA2
MSSPFARAKFEESTKHIYFLPRGISNQIESARSTVLLGSRGSGKTTLLRALDWQERIENETLRKQLGGDPFRGRFIGVYTKLSEHACKSLDSLHCQDEPTEGQIFGFYLDLLFVELIANGISSLISNNVLTGNVTEIEREAAKEFASKWVEVLAWCDAPEIRTFLDIANALTQIRHRIERVAQRSFAPHAIFDQFRVPAFGEFSRWSFRHFGSICDSCGPHAVDVNESWHFKICLDEAEVLSGRQQIVVNTLIRIASAPLFLVVSYVSKPVDLSRTLLPGLTLQKADFHQLSLDDQSPSDFKELAEGVASVRVQQHVNDDTVAFLAQRTLGKLSINQLLHEIVLKSESGAAVELDLQARRFAKEWSNTGEDSGEYLPYYQAFIATTLELGPPDSSEFKSRRKQESEEFRKKMVVAYLALCRRLGKRLPMFAFAEMVLGVSDGCIRDFLSQLHQIYLTAFPKLTESNLRQFLSETVSPTVQDLAMRQASEEKRDSIPRSGVLRPVLVGKLVRGLAEITAELQSQAATNGALVEVGVFQLRGGTRVERQDASRIVRDAVEAGFLRLKDTDSHSDPLDGFRVHTSLAPSFGFSYRGAYYPVVIHIEQFSRLLNLEDKRLSAVAKEFAASFSTSQPASVEWQRRLFTDDDLNAEDEA